MRVLFLVGLLYLTARARAAQFTFSQEQELIPEVGKVIRYRLRTDQGDYSFQPPRLWQVVPRSEEKEVIFRYEPWLAGITLTIQGTNEVSAATEPAKAFLEVVTRDFPLARLLETAECHTRNASGPQFELFEDKGPGRSPLIRRVAFLKGKNSVIKLELFSPQQHFSSCLGPWTLFINSLVIQDR